VEYPATDLFELDAAAAYERRRLVAFSLAGEGEVADALRELSEGSRDEWPFLEHYAADVACVQLIGGDPQRALGALALGVRGAARLPKLNRTLLALCVEADRSLWRRALAVSLSGGRLRERLAGTAAIARAVLFARPLVLVPVVVTRDGADTAPSRAGRT
jgi:hypothetical protein